MVYTAPEGYKEAVQADTRDLDVFIAIGTNIDSTAADDISSIEGSFLPMTNVGQMTDANYQMTEWMATFEADGIKTAVNAGHIAPPITAVSYPPEVGIWSDVISDKDGNIDWSLTIRLSATHTSALTVYTYDSNILEAEASFYIGEELQKTVPMEAYSGRVTEVEAVSYDRIVIHVTKLERPYTHVKIVEVEFGASVTYNKNSLTDVVSIIQEIDPTMQAIPLYELDFSLLNVLGEYDPDNPNGTFDSLEVNYPVEASISVYKDGKQYTVPMGRFLISEKVASDTVLTITAFDSRVAFQGNYTEVSLKTSQSFGDFFTEFFADFQVPYEIDDGLFSMYPDQDITFDSEQYDVLTCLLFMEQYYGIWLVPQRNGNIRITTEPPAGDFGLMAPEMMYSYPLPSSFQSYNYIQVSYGEETISNYVVDLRSSASQAKSQVSINNPLIKTENKAMEVAQRIVQGLYTSQVETQWRADPTLDMNDAISLAGKWTADKPTQYKTIYQDIEYNGGLTSTIRTVR